MKKKSLVITVALVLTSFQVAAQGIPDLKINGFFTAGSTYSDVNDEYIERITDTLSYSDTRFGLTIRANPSEKVSVQGQLLMGWSEEAEEQYVAKLDWGFASYRPSDIVTVHVGRLKFPNLMFTETFSVGVLNPWARLPQEIYNVDGGGSNLVFSSFDGTQVTLTTSLGDTDLQFDSYLGSTAFEGGEFEDMVGYVLSLSRNNTVIKAGFTRGEMEIEEANEQPIIEGETRTSWSVSAKTEWNNLALWAEYGSSQFDGFGAADEAGPFDIDLSELDTDAWYVAAAYRIGDFTPVITIASQEQASGSGQDSLTFGLNYNFSDSAIVKIEWTRVDPTERSDTSALTLAGFDEQAGLFYEGIEESDANIITLSLDLVF